MDTGRAAGVRAGPLRVLAHPLQLAALRGRAQRVAAVLHVAGRRRRRRRRRALPARALAPRRRAAAAADPRLAGLDRRVPRRRRRPDRPAGPARRVPPGDPVAARLRVQQQADGRRLGGGAHRGRVGAAHGPPRLRPLRRAGRRLGLDDHRGAGLGDPGGGRRHPPDDADGAAPRLRRAAAQQGRAEGARRAQGVHEGGHRLRPASRPPGRRRSDTGSSTRPSRCAPGSSRSSGTGASARATRATRSGATACSTT